MPSAEQIDQMREENASEPRPPIFQHIDTYLTDRGWRIDVRPEDDHDVLNYGDVYYAPDGRKVGGWLDAIDMQATLEEAGVELTNVLAERVASRMRRDGFDCTKEDVWEVRNLGQLVDDRESLASRILQEFEELGIEAGP